MKFFLPKFRIASLEAPQTTFQNKFGGLPWGLPLKMWRHCQSCGRRMSLLAQLKHEPPALDLGRSGDVLHLFQCQECFGFESGDGNDALIIPVNKLGTGLTRLPEDEDLSGALGQNLDQTIGELWIDSWKVEDDGFDPSLATDIFAPAKWAAVPDSMTPGIDPLRRIILPRDLPKIGEMANGAV